MKNTNHIGNKKTPMCPHGQFLDRERGPLPFQLEGQDERRLSGGSEAQELRTKGTLCPEAPIDLLYHGAISKETTFQRLEWSSNLLFAMRKVRKGLHSQLLFTRSFKSINLRRLFEVDDRNTKEQPTTKEEKHRQTPIQHGNKAGGQNSNLNCLNKTLDASFWAPNLLPYPGWQPSFMQVSGSMLYQHTHVPRFVLRMLGLEMKTFERGLGTVRWTKHRHTPRFM